MVHQPAIRVSYDVVRLLTPYLYEGKRVDFTLHIGMAGSRGYYSIEDKAHIKGYRAPDVDGDLCSYAWDGRMKHNELLVSPAEAKNTTNEFGDKTDAAVADADADADADASAKEYWFGVDEQVAEDWTSLPEVLHPAVDVMRVLRYWDKALGMKEDVRVSEDAGRYLCEFIYWCSLAHCEVQRNKGEEVDKRGKVLFLHVPGEADGPAINKGVDIVVALCKAIAEVCQEDKSKFEADVDGAAKKKENKKSVVDEVEMFDSLDQLSDETKAALLIQLEEYERDATEASKERNERQFKDSLAGCKQPVDAFDAGADGANDDYYPDSDAYDCDKWSGREDPNSTAGGKIEDNGIFVPYRKMGRDGPPLPPSRRGPKRKHLNRNNGGKRYEAKRQKDMEAKTTAAEEGKKETARSDDKMPFYRSIGQRDKAMVAKDEAAEVQKEKKSERARVTVEKTHVEVKKDGEERIVIDKRYEGYTLGIPFHEPVV